MDSQEKAIELLGRKVTRRDALKVGGVAGLGLAFSRPLVTALKPKQAFGQTYGPQLGQVALNITLVQTDGVTCDPNSIFQDAKFDCFGESPPVICVPCPPPAEILCMRDFPAESGTWVVQVEPILNGCAPCGDVTHTCESILDDLFACIDDRIAQCETGPIDTGDTGGTAA